MSQEEKSLLALTISPLSLLLLGLILAWFVLGSQIITLLKTLLSVKMLLFLILFAIAGLIFGQPGLKAMSKYMPYSDQVPAGSKDRQRLLSVVITLILGILFCAFVPAFPDLSKKSLGETALRLIITGLGLSVMFGTLFTSASIISFRSQRDL